MIRAMTALPARSGERLSGRERASRVLARLVRDAGALLALSSTGTAAPDRRARQWRDALRPTGQVLWVQLDGHRDDWVQPLAPIEAVVADGMLMAHVAVRMALKNAMLVSALRDRTEFDPSRYAALAAEELRRIAKQNESTAMQLDPIVEALPDLGHHSLVERLGYEEQVRRPNIHRALAASLRQAVAEPGLLPAMVEQAQRDAADEYREALRLRLEAASSFDRLPSDGEKAESIRLLVEKDLAALRRGRATAMAPTRGRWVSTRRR